MPMRQTDGRTPDRYITLSAIRRQRDNAFRRTFKSETQQCVIHQHVPVQNLTTLKLRAVRGSHATQKSTN